MGDQFLLKDAFWAGVAALNGNFTVLDIAIIRLFIIV
jgi:hypothetical protein